MNENNTLAPAANNTVSTVASVGGKSELLDAGQLLKDVLEVKSGDVVADLGAGGGLFLMQAARMVGDLGQVYAVDVVKGVLSDIESKARLSGLHNIKTVWSNLEMVGAAKIKDESLDSAVLVNVLHQSKKHYEILAEASRLLKNGGKLLVIDWANNNLTFGPPKDQLVESSEIVNQCQQLDLNLIKLFKAGPYHFGLLFGKK